jgi:CBS domain containing-hemolysin-like protein
MSDQKNVTPSTDSQNSVTKQPEATSKLPPISADLVTHLFELSKKVVKDEVTPATVMAACKCASEIHKLLDFRLQAKKVGL